MGYRREGDTGSGWEAGEKILNANFLLMIYFSVCYNT